MHLVYLRGCFFKTSSVVLAFSLKIFGRWSWRSENLLKLYSTYPQMLPSGFVRISGFPLGFLNFATDFWISLWTSRFLLGFLDFALDSWTFYTLWLSGSLDIIIASRSCHTLLKGRVYGLIPLHSSCCGSLCNKLREWHCYFLCLTDCARELDKFISSVANHVEKINTRVKSFYIKKMQV